MFEKVILVIMNLKLQFYRELKIVVTKATTANEVAL